MLKKYFLNDFFLIIKLDVEGNEINVIKGSTDVIKQFNPLIIIEFSKYMFQNPNNIEYLKFFLNKYDYSIYDTNFRKKELEDIINI